MSDTLLRQWNILRLIPRQPGKISTREIKNKLQSQGFDVHIRTIQRDLEKLSAIWGLVCDEHKPGGLC